MTPRKSPFRLIGTSVGLACFGYLAVTLTAWAQPTDGDDGTQPVRSQPVAPPKSKAAPAKGGEASTGRGGFGRSGGADIGRDTGLDMGGLEAATQRPLPQGSEGGAPPADRDAGYDPFLQPLPASDPEPQPGEQRRLGDAYLKLGQLERAATAYRVAVSDDPEDIAAHERLRRVMIDARRTERLPDVLARTSRLYLEAARAVQSADPQASQHNKHKASERLDELILLAPEHAERVELEQALGRVTATAETDPLHITARLRSALGILVLLFCAFLLSNNRKKVSWRIVAWGMGLQIAFAFLILWTPPGRWIFEVGKEVVNKILSFTDYGAGFLFGEVYNGIVPVGNKGPVMITDGTTGDPAGLGLIFAFHILPTIIFFGSLMSVLYHFGIVQKIVHGIAWIMVRTMKTSGAESLSAAGNIFVGQTEAPLLIKPYVDDMTMSELMAVMTGGFATVAGGVLAAYVRFGIDAGHLLAASVMSAPAALVVAKIMYPELGTPQTVGGAVHDPKKTTSNVIDAAASGATDGLKLAFNVAAMLLAFIALIAMVNWMLSPLGISLREIFGYAFYPISWVMGVDTKDLLDFGTLLGTKISINEFVAFIDLGNMKSQLSERSFLIATYAMCGFANFSSIGIQIGGISAIAPERRQDLARIGLKAMIGGAIASWLTACIAGVLL